MAEPPDDPLDRLRDLLRRDPVDPKPGAKPETEGEFERFAGFLRLSLAVNLFHRAAVLTYGPTTSVPTGVLSAAFGLIRVHSGRACGATSACGSWSCSSRSAWHRSSSGPR